MPYAVGAFVRNILLMNPLRNMRRNALPELSGPIEKNIDALTLYLLKMSKSLGRPSRYPLNVSISTFIANLIFPIQQPLIFHHVFLS